MQKKAPNLRVNHLTDENRILKELKDMKPLISFRKMRAEVTNVAVWNLSDDIVSGREYGQTGIINGHDRSGRRRH